MMAKKSILVLYFNVRELEHRLNVFNNETGRNLDANDVMERILYGEIEEKLNQDIIDFAAWYNHNGKARVNDHERPWLAG